MPHRATYIFPRQFPERGLNESQKKILDHEKQKVVGTVKSSDTTFGVENDVAAPKSSRHELSRASKADGDVLFSQRAAAVSDLFNTVRGKHKQVEAFCESLLRDNKSSNRHHHHHRPGHRLKLHRNRHDVDDGEALLPPPVPVKDSVDRQVSLPRLSSGSSLFTLDDGTATFSSDVTKDDTTSSFRVISAATAAAEEARNQEQQKEEKKTRE